ncbi:6-phospho-3-hexuloisomerase [Pedobacter sp. MR22-3]|uniref:6-phospho-3-hexuloisomerase n=1 Tax=Pedobacter sp. MR22-3 TaxID=2994552 RepID=UPI00224784E4|nr:6-phospho-3-hexuloisomerase [Pedobacter sp. MR22-3]MCX2585286.1 6-phospho-3-hexuloisomerase [Pedobacter sp. MR22-3]
MQNETEELADNQQLVWDLQMNLELVLNENLKLVKDIDLESLVPLIGYIQQSPRIFIVSAGRSGFAMRAAAMRLMHLGLQVYIVGDTTTPAINQEDLLIAASGSGTTSGIVRAAEKAVSIGAKLVTLTADPNAALAKLADHVVYIPAAGKEEHGSGKSAQYAGSLFEQFLMLLLDAVFQSLWKLDGTPAAALYQRHANLE